MVFVKHPKRNNEDLPMATLLGKRFKEGEVGIEVEVEGRQLPVPPSKFWVGHDDGSLRGESLEYVLRAPLSFNDANTAVDTLYDAFKANKTTFADSNRTSVHVHLNVLPFHMNRLVSLMGLWFTVEDILAHWCGEHRVGNLFCLRAKDSPSIIKTLTRFITNNGDARLPEGLHYSAFNCHALAKFGSVEIRTLRGVSDGETLKTWLAILRRLYERSAEIKDPREVIQNFSYEGPYVYFHALFGELAPEIIRGSGFTEDQLRDSLYEGMRLAQDLCFSRDWSSFAPIEVKQDPFGRKIVKTPEELLEELENIGWDDED